MDEAPSYHDLHITTAAIPRTAISDLPFGLEVSCNRVGGWCLWRDPAATGHPVLVAGEYEGPALWLVLDVAGHVILDSRRDDQP